MRFYNKGFYLAFSGGRDSQALYHVAKLAGVKFEAHMNMTTVDPAPVVSFVKREYPDEGRLCATRLFNGEVQFGFYNSEECEWENRDADGKWRTSWA